MDIGTVMAAIQTIEGTLSITSPFTLTVARAYLYIPDRVTEQPDNDPFCFFNGYTLVREDRLPNAQREQWYAVDIQGFARDPSLDKASQIASAFLAAFLTAFDAKQKLGGACTNQEVRGKTPTLTRLEWAGQSYIGLNLTMNVYMRDSTTAGA